MVRTGAAMLCILWTAAIQAAPAYQVDKREIALGEAVNLTLTARPGALDRIDLAPLARDFELRDRSLNHGPHADSLSVTLYPRTAGRLSLRVPGLPGRAPVVRVDDRSATIPKVRFQVELDPSQPVVRQPFTLVVEACDDGTLLWQHPALTTSEGLYIRRLGDRQAEVERDGEHCTANRWRWAVTPTAAGSFTLPLPTLEAGKFGEPLRYPPPRVAFDVRPVPAWLPDGIAVGAVDATADAVPVRSPLDRPLTRHLRVKGAYSRSALRKVLDLQLAGHPALDRYAPDIVALAPDDDSPVPRFDVTLYARPDGTGRFEFPALALPWFDPASGQIHDVELGPAAVRIFDPKRIWSLRIAVGGLAALGLALAGRRLYRTLRWRRVRRRGLAAVGAARTPQQVAAALRAFPIAEAAPPAPTLRAWLRRGAPRDAALQDQVERLERACYGEDRPAVDALREELVARLARTGRRGRI